MYDPDEREAMSAYLASEHYTPALVGAEIERWTSSGGGFVVEFPVHGDTTADVHEGRAGGEPGRKLGRAVGLVQLDDLLPRL